MIVRMIVVVRSDVGGVLVSPGGGGGGDTIPGELICPAKAETLSVKNRIVAAHVWRKVFILLAPYSEIEKFCMICEILHQASGAQLFLQERGRLRKICAQFHSLHSV